jgi:serine/threonine protein kinase/dipeptidyl aminopeptidase/acylaminoacyl peptidase
MGAVARSDPLALTAGSRLGPYEVLSLLGSGGMGEVYRARDPRLDREVAIKVLPAERMDEERRRRFVQEARAASSLNHPNIVTIHEIDSAEGRDFIVMEYVPGKSLDRLIPRHGMPLGEVLRIAIPVADALSRAHGRGIVHRDVKPSNVIAGSEGAVKLLDFGLAKLTASGTTSPEAETETAGPPLTRAGTVSGTVGYMSPEQASGGEVDARTDVFSFGAVLYEMATGRRAFSGDSPAATLAAVMREQPKAPSEVAADVPRDLERVVLRCLRKEADRRYQSMADVKLELEQIKEDSDSQPLAGAVPLLRRRRRYLAVAGLAAMLVLSAAVWLTLRTRAPGPPPPRVVPLTALPGWAFSPTFSQDGEQVAFAWDGGTLHNSDIYVKWVGTPEVHRLTTDPAPDNYPSWSPDGRQIAFVRRSGDEETIHLVSPLGGPAQRLSHFSVGWGGPSWSPDGRWLAASGGRPGSAPAHLRTTGIHVLPTSGGGQRVLTQPSPPGVDVSPAFAPDGRHLAYASCPNGLHEGGCDVYVFDLDADVRPAGPPRRLTHHGVAIPYVTWTRDGASIVYNADEGVYLLHLWRVGLRGDRPAERIELAGHRVWSLGLARTRDRLAFAETLRDVDIQRFRGEQPSEVVVSSSFFDGHPHFSPDGKRIAFASSRSGDRTEIWLAAADGSGPAQLTHGPGSKQRSSCWSPDGRRIAFDSLSADGRWDIWTVDAEGGAPVRLTKGGGNVPSWSRDGRFVYFHAVRDGSGQVWRVPASGGVEERVTRGGAGHGAMESADGRSLFFKRSDGNSPLVALTLAGGAERTVAPCVRAWPAVFDVVASGVYYPDCRAGDPGLHRFDPPSGRDELLGVLENAEQPADTTIAVSPDGRTILYPKVVREGSDLRLIENFR